MQALYRYLAVFLVSFCLGGYYTYNKYVPTLESQLEQKQDTINILREINRKQADYINQKDVSEISYVKKNSSNDSDVEITDKNDIKVRVNETDYVFPNDVDESSKFENGKLVISKENTTIVDLTKTVNELADEKAKQYSRIGKADFGLLYNRKGNDIYGGLRYNAKMFDVGYYHDVDSSDWLVGVHYKF